MDSWEFERLDVGGVPVMDEKDALPTMFLLDGVLADKSVGTYATVAQAAYKLYELFKSSSENRTNMQLRDLANTLQHIADHIEEIQERLIRVELLVEKFPQHLVRLIKDHLVASGMLYSIHYPDFGNEKIRIKYSQKIYDMLSKESLVLRLNGYHFVSFVILAMFIEHDVMHFLGENIGSNAKKETFKLYTEYLGKALSKDQVGSPREKLIEADKRAIAIMKEIKKMRKELPAKELIHLRSNVKIGGETRVDVWVKYHNPDGNKTMWPDEMKIEKRNAGETESEWQVEVQENYGCILSVFDQLSATYSQEVERKGVASLLAGVTRDLANVYRPKNRLLVNKNREWTEAAEKRATLLEMVKAAKLALEKAEKWSRDPSQDRPALP